MARKPAKRQEATPNRPAPKGTKAPTPPKGVIAPEVPVQPYGTDKNYDNPADANERDVKRALSSSVEEKAPQPFRKRDGFPDITSESVNLRMLADYYPKEGRFPNSIRARKGELVAFPPDEALDLIEAGIGKRVDDEHAGIPDAEGDAR